MSYGYYFDMTNCIGCRACQIACKDKNDLPVGTLFRQVESIRDRQLSDTGVLSPQPDVQPLREPSLCGELPDRCHVQRR